MPFRQPSTSPVFLDNTFFVLVFLAEGSLVSLVLLPQYKLCFSTYLKTVECDNSEAATFCCRLESCCHQSTLTGHLGTVCTAYRCMNLIQTYNTVKLQKVSALILPNTDNSKIRLPRSKTNSLSTRNAVAIAVEIELTPYGCLALVL